MNNNMYIGKLGEEEIVFIYFGNEQDEGGIIYPQFHLITKAELGLYYSGIGQILMDKKNQDLELQICRVREDGYDGYTVIKSSKQDLNELLSEQKVTFEYFHDDVDMGIEDIGNETFEFYDTPIDILALKNKNTNQWFYCLIKDKYNSLNKPQFENETFISLNKQTIETNTSFTISKFYTKEEYDNGVQNLVYYHNQGYQWCEFEEEVADNNSGYYKKITYFIPYEVIPASGELVLLYEYKDVDGIINPDAPPVAILLGE